MRIDSYFQLSHEARFFFSWLVIWCCMCLCNEDTANHLLMLPKRVVDLLFCVVLVREALTVYLKVCPTMFDVVIVEGMK